MSMEPTWGECAARASGGGNWQSGATIESLVSLSERPIPSESALLAAKAEIIAEWAIAGTYLVQPEGFRLATAEKDQAAFVSLLTLLREADAPPPENLTIFDYLGAPVVVSLARFREIMVAYGMAIYSARSSQ